MLTALFALALSQSSPAQVTLIFGGDVIPHDPIKYVAGKRARGGEDPTRDRGVVNSRREPAESALKGHGQWVPDDAAHSGFVSAQVDHPSGGP